MKTAMLNGKEKDAEAAVALRDASPTIIFDFRCPSCNEAVKVFRAGGKMPAHFEHLDRHLDRNPVCPLVHIPPK